MPHIIVLEEAFADLQTKAAVPPTAKQQSLLDAMTAADAYAHGESPDEGVLAQIEDAAIAVKGYLAVITPPILPYQDNRLEGWANELNGLIS